MFSPAHEIRERWPSECPRSLLRSPSWSPGEPDPHLPNIRGPMTTATIEPSAKTTVVTTSKMFTKSFVGIRPTPSPAMNAKTIMAPFMTVSLVIFSVGLRIFGTKGPSSAIDRRTRNRDIKLPTVDLDAQRLSSKPTFHPSPWDLPPSSDEGPGDLDRDPLKTCGTHPGPGDPRI